MHALYYVACLQRRKRLRHAVQQEVVHFFDVLVTLIQATSSYVVNRLKAIGDQQIGALNITNERGGGACY